LPLGVHALDEEAARAAYQCRFCLVRPDGHVAWRGDQPPMDAGPVLDAIRGAAPKD